MKELIILGSTGSIGTQTLDVVRKYPLDYRVIALSLGHDLEKDINILTEFRPKYACARTKKDAIYLESIFPSIEFTYGDIGLSKVATFDSENSNVYLVVALVGSIGILPTVKAIEIGRNILLANKEVLVTSGEIIMPMAKKNNVLIIPIDSEHSAIFQCLQGESIESVKKLIITASGGAFRDLSLADLSKVTKSDALKHPNWLMGEKITIDCATMMNKGFEVIEAHYLFDIPYEKIEAIIHPESIIHSMVEFKDSSIKAQIGKPDMHIPILYALSYPNRLSFDNELNIINLKFSFKEIDYDKYPCFCLALEAARKGNIYPTVLNAANEAAVKLFLNDKINFLDIYKIVLEMINRFSPSKELTIDEILRVDSLVKKTVFEEYGGID